MEEYYNYKLTKVNGVGNCVHKDAVAPFSTYNVELQEVISQENLLEMVTTNDVKLLSLLNGRASVALQRTVPQEVRKNSGIFFTNHNLSEKIAERLSGTLAEGIRVADPACGAGNLLLACAKHLPIGNSLNETVAIWSGFISGSDLFEEFIMATKLRLILLAAIRSRDISNIDRLLLDSETFPYLKTSDILSTEYSYRDTGCIVINPPFSHMKVIGDCEWATGKIQTAAWFIERIFRSASPNQHIIAILPDVLRSGTRYRKWRKLIASQSASLTIEAAGQFDAETDVDVFILDSVVRSETEGNAQWLDASSINKKTQLTTVSDYFDVSVGTIVPHRDPKEGDLYPYLHALNAKKGITITSISETIQTKRKVFTPPFVALHRTSSPNDKPRCVASIINGGKAVAVENHIIVLQPKSETLDICTKLMKVLNSEYTDRFMNERIRCRHLTVPSINEIPWIEE